MHTAVRHESVDPKVRGNLIKDLINSQKGMRTVSTSGQSSSTDMNLIISELHKLHQRILNYTWVREVNMNVLVVVIGSIWRQHGEVCLVCCICWLLVLKTHA